MATVQEKYDELKLKLEENKQTVADERVEVQAKVKTLVDQNAAQVTEIQRLTDLLAAGGTITEVQMQTLLDTATEIGTGIKDILTV